MPSGAKKRKNAKKRKDGSAALESSIMEKEPGAEKNTDCEVQEEQDEEPLTPKTPIRASESDDRDRALQTDEWVRVSDLDVGTLQSIELKTDFDGTAEEEASPPAGVRSLADWETVSEGLNLERDDDVGTVEGAGAFSKVDDGGEESFDVSMQFGDGDEPHSLQDNVEGPITSEWDLAESLAETDSCAYQEESNQQIEQATQVDTCSIADGESMVMTEHISEMAEENLPSPAQHGHSSQPLEGTVPGNDVQQVDGPKSDEAQMRVTEFHETQPNEEAKDSAPMRSCEQTSGPSVVNVSFPSEPDQSNQLLEATFSESKVHQSIEDEPCASLKPDEVQPSLSSSTKEQVQLSSIMGDLYEDERSEDNKHVDSSVVAAAEESGPCGDVNPDGLLVETTDVTESETTDVTESAGNFEFLASEELGRTDGSEKQSDGFEQELYTEHLSLDVLPGGDKKVAAEAGPPDETSVLDQLEQLLGGFSQKRDDIICLQGSPGSRAANEYTSEAFFLGHTSSGSEYEEPADVINIAKVATSNVPEIADLSELIGDTLVVERMNEKPAVLEDPTVVAGVGGSSEVATEVSSGDLVIGDGDVKGTQSTVEDLLEEQLLPEQVESAHVAVVAKPIEAFEVVDPATSKKVDISGKLQKEITPVVGPQRRNENTVKNVLDTTGCHVDHQCTMAIGESLGHAKSNDERSTQVVETQQEAPNLRCLSNPDPAERKQVHVNGGYLDQRDGQTSWKGCCGVLDWLLGRQE